MKRLMLAAAALAVPLFGAAAHAASINFGGYSGPILITYGNFDVGRVYTIAPGTTVSGIGAVNALPQTDAASPNTPVAGGGAAPITGSTNVAEDTWGIAKVTAIYAGTDTLAPIIYQSGNPALQGNTQVTAIFFGGSDVQVSADANGIQTTSTAGVQFGLFASNVGDNTDGLDLSSSPTAAVRGNSPISYAGITDGTLIFSFIGEAGHFLDAPSAEQQSTFDPTRVNGGNPSIPIGQGTLFLQKHSIDFGAGAVTGTENNILVDTPSPSADAQVQFTTREGTRDFTVTSNDPALTFISVPAPSTAGAGLLGVAGLALGRLVRRRRQVC